MDNMTEQYYDENGCTPDCPIRQLNEQSGVSKSQKAGFHGRKDGIPVYGIHDVYHKSKTMLQGGMEYGDEGGASRYFQQFYPDAPEPLNQQKDTMRNQILQGDCLEILRTLDANSLDSCVVDPPYGLGEVKDIAGLLMAWMTDTDDKAYVGKSGFMGTQWDSSVPGPRYWKEVLRVLKPGAHILAFAGTRTYDLLVIALRLAGFEIRDQIDWLYGSGFPKSMDISKAIDKIKDRSLLGRLADEIKRARTEAGLSLRNVGQKMQVATDGQYGTWYRRGGHMFFETGISLPSRPEWEHFKYILPINPEFYGVYDEAEREVIGQDRNWGKAGSVPVSAYGEWDITAPATPEAQRYSGFGTNLKPAHEPICLARKPLAESSIAANVLEWGTGAINIDATRVTGESTLKQHTNGAKQMFSRDGVRSDNGRPANNRAMSTGSDIGRWPANLLLSHSVWCVPNGVKKVPIGGGQPHEGNERTSKNIYNGLVKRNSSTYHGDSEGMEQVEDWLCTEDCPVRLLDEQSGHSVSKAGNRGRPFTSQGSHEGWKRPSHEHYTDGYSPISDQGGASRYFQRFYYCSKASRSERNKGCEGLPEQANRINAPRSSEGEKFSPSANHHPCVKPINLVRYLVRMITPPGGICLDCFGGSGTTALACIAEGVDYLIIEQEQSYIEIATARINHALAQEPKTEQRVDSWDCVPECPVKMLDEQSGICKSGAKSKISTIGFGNTNNHVVERTTNYEANEGGASRYFTQLAPDNEVA